MLSKVLWFLILLISTTLAISTAPPPASVSTAASAPVPAPTSQPLSTPSSPSTPLYSYKTAPPVFTADSVRHTTHTPPPGSSTHAGHGRTRQPQKQPNYYDVDAGIGRSGLADGPTLASVENNYNNDIPYTIEHRTLQDEDGQEPEGKQDDAGFVPPVDFSSILSELDRVSGQDSRDVLRNPFATAETRNRNRDGGFPSFFNERDQKENVFEPNFGSLASSASDQKTRKVKEDDDEGFVDANVQFRSLFDSTETADGFRPSDFLDYQGDTSGADLSKPSQSRAYPQFTYTGRDGDGSDAEGDDEEDDVYRELANPRYRSSYRQVDSRNRDPYDDRNYYSGERDRSPAPPAAPPTKYKVGGGGGSSGSSGGGKGKGAHAGEETAHSPQSSGSSGGSKGDSPGKNKCKKVEKLVEENEEYDSYVEPEEGYDPSTYSGRYKRQTRGQSRNNKGSSNSNKKRPMTCYVCEDEEGRYAERCSYDSKADPKQGSYFHSSSTSFNDNGNNRRGKGNNRGGGGGGGDRYKRDPEHSAPAKLEAQASTDSDSRNGTTLSEGYDFPKTVHKRQSSSGGRRGQGQSGGYPRENPSPRPRLGLDEANRRQQEYEDADEEDYESPYAPYGTDAGREEYGFDRAPAGRRNTDRTRGRNEFDIRIPTPDYAADPGRGRGDREREEDYDDEPPFDYGPPSSSPSSRGREGGNRGRSNSPEIDFDLGPPGPSYGGEDGGNRRAGGGGGSGGRRNNNSGRGGQDFPFGAPADFGRDEGERSRGFQVDFSIPKEFDPDHQLGASNTNNRPIFSNSGFGEDFDGAYEEHVKRYFPDAFGGSGGGGGGGGSSSTPGPERGHSPPIGSSTFRPHDGPGGPGPYYSSSSRPPPPQGPVYPHGNRGRSPTQQRHRYSPPPYFNGPRGHYAGGGGGGPQGHSNEDDIGYSPGNSNGGHLHQAINAFQQKGPGQGCSRVQKGDMSCIVCQDPRGMKKEECMYASNDPKNHQMAYHEVSEYSSNAPQAVLPHSPKPNNNNKNKNNHHVESSKIIHSESRRVEIKKLPKPKSEPIDYDFDY